MRIATSYLRLVSSGSIRVLALALLAAAFASIDCRAEGPAAAEQEAQPKAESAQPEEPAAEADRKAKPRPKLPPPSSGVPFPGSKHVWFNREKKQVFVDGEVTLRRGVLEMFACISNTKEHESVVAVHSRAYPLHTALLLVGAKSGTPVDYREKYIPPTGDQIKITVEWLDEKGKKRSAPAQQWVRNVKTRKAMDLAWVFAGSGFWRDDQTGKQHYMAEGGDLICVANFSTAMLDVAAKSTQAQEGLMFEAFTENVPPLGTPVRLTLSPEKKQDKKPAAEPTKPKPKD